MSLLEVEEKGLLQMDIWKQSINLDAQQPHNLCFCPETDQTDSAPANL